jgi:hypothetical protein
MNRNLELENRIKERKTYDRLQKINSYGGMGMDGISVNEKKLRLDELEYIRNHPEIFKKNIQTNDNSIYLIKLK